MGAGTLDLLGALRGRGGRLLVRLDRLRSGDEGDHERALIDSQVPDVDRAGSGRSPASEGASVTGANLTGSLDAETASGMACVLRASRSCHLFFWARTRVPGELPGGI